MSDANKKLVLITGAAGMIGRDMRVLLRDRYRLRLMYHNTVLPAEGDEQVVIGDIADLDLMRKAVEGVDAVLHLAANAQMDTSWDLVLRNNIVGCYNCYEACRQAGVNKIVFASTNHVAGYYEIFGELPVTPAMPVRPDTYYGASKAFGETLGRYYSDAFGLSVICLRIGSYLPRPKVPRNLATWLSPPDMAQAVWRAVETDIRFGVYYTISNNRRRYWDISSAQDELGYAPEDDAEEYATEIIANAPKDQETQIWVSSPPGWWT